MTAERGLAPRRAALAAVRRVRADHAWSTYAVPEAVAALTDPRDRGLAAHLAYETLRWTGTTAWILDATLSRSRSSVETELLEVLELGVVQLLRTRIPARAAVATSVALARACVPKQRAAGAAGFVNGVLRAGDRNRARWEAPEADGNVTRQIALATGHPDWIVTDLCQRWDDRRVHAILSADNAPPGVTLRANVARGDLLDELHAAGVDAQPGSHSQAVHVSAVDPRLLAAVVEGRAVVQDEASLAVVDATGVVAGNSVLDMCAAPGGKTTELARRVGPDGQVCAVELHSHRAAMITESAQRQGVDVEVIVGDARTVVLPHTFDVVLVDAPCTGLGTGRRRPEIRWTRTPDDAVSLATVQRSLLAAAERALAPGGRLVYSVCTWTALETDEVARAFDATSQLTAGERRQLYPDVDGTDGMYIATWHA